MSHPLISAEISVVNRIFPIFLTQANLCMTMTLWSTETWHDDARAAKGDAEANGWTTERWYKARMSNGAMGCPGFPWKMCWMCRAQLSNGRGAVFSLGRSACSHYTPENKDGTPKMKVWKMNLLFKGVIFRFKTLVFGGGKHLCFKHHQIFCNLFCQRT